MHRNSSSRNAAGGDQRSGRGHGQGHGHGHGNGHGQNGGAAPPFKLLTRGAGQKDPDTDSPRPGMLSSGGGGLQQSQQQQYSQQQQQQPYPAYSQAYQSPYGLQQQQQTQPTLRPSMSRMPQAPQGQTHTGPPSGLGGMSMGMNIGMGMMNNNNNNNNNAPAVRGAVPGSMSGNGVGQQQQQQQQQKSQPTQQLSQTQTSESDAKESKPRRERRERGRRERSSRQSQQQNDSSRDDHQSGSSSDGLKPQQQQQQQTHRVIVDPNSFQRQILQPNPNSSGGVERKLMIPGSHGRGAGERCDEDTRGSEPKSSSRRQVPAGRTVYSWQGTNPTQQQQQQMQQQPQQQQQYQALRGPAGPYSQPGLRDVRSIGGAHSAGGPMSAGGRLLQLAPVLALPPPMSSHSVKLMNENGKILDGVEQPPQMAAVAGFQTSGIDMYVTPERMILLDTEPIFCLSNLENALRNERIADGVPVDIWLDHQAMAMATFLMSVCNVVMVMVEDGAGASSRVFKLLQRVEVFMKALSQSSTLNNTAHAVNSGVGGQPSIAQDGFQRDGLGDWCADIVLVLNKVPVMKFGMEHYQRSATEQAYVLQHSNLQLFGSINMTGIYSRFEDAFKATASSNVNHGTKSQRKQLSAQSSGIESPLSDTDNTQDKEANAASNEQERQQQQQQQEQQEQHLDQRFIDERKTAQHLNLVLLPLDSTMSHSNNSSTTVSPHASPSSPSNSLQAAMASISISFNRENILGGSFNSPDHDIFATLVQDQERWKVWTKGLRNKILSFSMRPQGGPALGPRNRPGLVSEREWLRYANRTWETIRKASFLAEYVRAAKLSREG
ncbi:smg-9, nonsense mediated mRNA decay factor [Mortierella polycephala]|uniref:Smg-9, nonsense mediated mRNA decay factor n=1 Tax=Mortierella polycephala TaxID=41804 RepID=A0A9P6Q531_9FUNG|nr:smg-9, nonsense mediated mRNA decay factor [Mortierella polycephala]